MLQSGNAVHADAENLRVCVTEFGDISLIRLHFLRSTTGKGEDVKGEHDVLLAFEVTEFVTNASAVRTDDRARQSEVRRRLAESEGAPEAIAEQTRQRDERDRTRAESPLVQSPDAIYIDSTGLSPDEVEEAILKVIRKKLSNGKGF